METMSIYAVTVVDTRVVNVRASSEKTARTLAEDHASFKGPAVLNYCATECGVVDSNTPTDIEEGE